VHTIGMYVRPSRVCPLTLLWVYVKLVIGAPDLHDEQPGRGLAWCPSYAAASRQHAGHGLVVVPPRGMMEMAPSRAPAAVAHACCCHASWVVKMAPRSTPAVLAWTSSSRLASVESVALHSGSLGVGSSRLMGVVERASRCTPAASSRTPSSRLVGVSMKMLCSPPSKRCGLRFVLTL
jgi:hypothetical protein